MKEQDAENLVRGKGKAQGLGSSPYLIYFVFFVLHVTYRNEEKIQNLEVSLMFREPLLVRGQVLLFHLFRQLILHLLTANIHDKVTSTVSDPELELGSNGSDDNPD